MHNIKLIRNEPDSFSKKLNHRNANVSLQNILNLDEKNRELIQNKEKLEHEKKIISKKKTKVNFQDQKKYQEQLNNLRSLK